MHMTTYLLPIYCAPGLTPRREMKRAVRQLAIIVLSPDKSEVPEGLLPPTRHFSTFVVLKQYSTAENFKRFQ